MTNPMAYYQKIQELADDIIKSNPKLSQEQVCRKVHNQVGENSNTISDILLLMKRYNTFCKKGEQLNKRVIDSLVVQKIAPHSIREVTTCLVMETASVQDKRDLINHKISLNKFLRNSRTEEVPDTVTFVCQDIKNLDSLYVSTEQDTVNVFLAEVTRLEHTLDMIFSDKEDYINTFDEMSNASKEQIKNGCDRLERIRQVMLSVI